MMANQVSVVIVPSQYGPTDAIEATITNGTADAIRVADHQSGCTLLTLERQVGSRWTEQNPCLLRSPTRLITLAVGSVTPISVPPPTGGWAPGVYRATLVYRGAAGDDVSAVSSAHVRIA